MLWPVHGDLRPVTDMVTSDQWLTWWRQTSDWQTVGTVMAALPVAWHGDVRPVTDMVTSDQWLTWWRQTSGLTWWRQTSDLTWWRQTSDLTWWRQTSGLTWWRQTSDWHGDVRPVTDMVTSDQWRTNCWYCSGCPASGLTWHGQCRCPSTAGRSPQPLSFNTFSPLTH